MKVSDATMKQFRDTVYANFKDPGLQRSLSQDLVEERASRFQTWRRAANLDGSSLQLPSDFVRHWAAADILALRNFPRDKEESATKAVIQNCSSSSAYASIFRSIDTKLYDQIVESPHDATLAQAIARLRKPPTEQLINGFTSALPAPLNQPVPKGRAEADAVAEVEVEVEDQITPPQDTPLQEKSNNTSPIDPAAVISKILENASYKARADGTVLYSINNRAAFVDHGPQILMEPKADEDEDSILAAVLLAKEKYHGSFEVTGTDEFQRRTIDIIVKHGIEIELTSPYQQALYREISARRAPADVVPADKAILDTNLDTQSVLPLKNKVENGIAGSVDQPGTPSLAADLIAVNARAWWHVQRSAIHEWAKTDEELQADLSQLGTEPQADEIYWFDQGGRPCNAPADAAAYIASHQDDLTFEPMKELRSRAAINTTDSAAIEVNLTLKEFEMTLANEENAPDPKLVLRGVKQLESGEYDTTVLLFKGKGDYLQGFVKIGDQKHQVIAHLNKRHPDPNTGEVKPSFLKLAEPVAVGDDTKWKEIGFGNAVNRRKDGKEVFFDEVLLSVGNDLIKARVSKNVDADLHRQLGFMEDRKPRQPESTKDTPQDVAQKADAPKVDTPKVDTPKVDTPKADAQKADAQTTKQKKSLGDAKAPTVDVAPQPVVAQQDESTAKPTRSRARAKA